MRRLFVIALVTLGILGATTGTGQAGIGEWPHFKHAWLDHRGISLTMPQAAKLDISDKAWRRYERQVLHRAYVRWQYRLAHPPVEHFASPSPQHYSSGNSIDSLIISIYAGVAPGYTSVALCIADRESRDDPYAKNPYSSASGVFQWVASSWYSYSHRYGYGGSSVFNAYANIEVAAHAMADSGLGPWGGGC